jgi:histidyl-tRNA synthetase
MVTLGEEAMSYGLSIASTLRKKLGFIVVSDMLQKNMKPQLKEANKINSDYVIIIGDNEIINKEVLIKNMVQGEQEKVSLDKIVSYFKK